MVCAISNWGTWGGGGLNFEKNEKECKKYNFDQFEILILKGMCAVWICYGRKLKVTLMR